MTILYALVARGKTVLAEYTFTSGNFPTITRVLLGKIVDEDGKMSYVYDQYVFHYIIENHIIYMCMCDDMNKRRIPFGFLEDIRQRLRLLMVIALRLRLLLPCPMILAGRCRSRWIFSMDPPQIPLLK